MRIDAEDIAFWTAANVSIDGQSIVPPGLIPVVVVA